MEGNVLEQVNNEKQKWNQEHVSDDGKHKADEQQYEMREKIRQWIDAM